MRSSKQKLCNLVLSVFVATSYGCGGSEDPDLIAVALPATNGVIIESDFTATISPNDRWMVFYEAKPTSQSSSALARGWLRVLDLTTAELFEFELTEQQAPRASFIGTARWIPDGRYYIMPGFALAFMEGRSPQLFTELVYQKQAVTIRDVVVDLDLVDACSDCFEEQFDQKTIESLRKHHYEIGLLREHRQAVSPDAERLYFGDVRDRSRVLVCERELSTQDDRVLAKHTGRCAHVNYLRLSPDGQFLAYQFSTGCNFVRPPKLYIVDVETKVQWYVGDEVFYVMHWTSDSKRLYFAQRQPNNGPMQIHYVDVPRDDAVDNDHVKPAGSEKPSTNDAPAAEVARQAR